MKSNQLVDYLDVILRWRKFIVRNVFIVTAIAIIISLVLVKKYTATATILPPNPEQQLMLGFMPGLSSSSVPTQFSSMLSGLSGFATPSDLYAAIMKSSRIMREIIKKYDLKKRFKTKTMHDTFKELENISFFEVSPEGIIVVSVTYRDKYLATDIANSYVEELDKFNNETAMTMGKKYRIFVELRLVEAQDSLKRAEDELKDFQERNRTVAIDAELQAVIETIAQLKSQIIMFEVQKGAWSAAGQVDNPYLYQINRELAALKKQLAKIESGDKTKDAGSFGAGFAVPLSELPEVMLEFARLYRDVKVQEAIFELLTQQYEQAKIMEAKDTPTVQFLDKAGVPEKRSFPKRVLIVVLTFAVAIFANVLLAFVLEYVSDVKAKPDRHRSVLRFAVDLSDDFQGFKNFVIKALRRKKN